MMQWFFENWMMLASVLLGISEALALLAKAVPGLSGFGGILAGFISFLQGVGAKSPKE